MSYHPKSPSRYGIKIEGVFSGIDNVYASLYYGPPNNKIIVMSDKGNIRVYSEFEPEFPLYNQDSQNEIRLHETNHRSLVKWTDDSYLGHLEGVVFCNSIVSPYRTLKTFSCLSFLDSVTKIGRVCEDLFVVFSKEHLYVVNFEENMVERKIEQRDYSHDCVLIISSLRIHRGSVYYNINQRNKVVLHDLAVSGKIKLELNEGGPSTVTGCNWLTERNSEILAISGGAKRIDLFEVSDKCVNVGSIRTRNYLYGLCCVQEKYLVAGDLYGYIEILDIQNYPKDEYRGDVCRLKNKCINQNTFVSVHGASDDRRIRMLSSTDGKVAVLYSIKGLEGLSTETSVEMEDLEERVSFLTTSKDLYIFGQRDDTWISLKVVTEGFLIRKFLLL